MKAGHTSNISILRRLATGCSSRLGDRDRLGGLEIYKAKHAYHGRETCAKSVAHSANLVTFLLITVCGLLLVERLEVFTFGFSLADRTQNTQTHADTNKDTVREGRKRSN
jgi:hypothetical protein